jgi:hypothetical protein
MRFLIILILLIPMASALPEGNETCDWKIDISLKEPITERIEWKILVSKNFGKKNRLVLKRTVKDLSGNEIKGYNNLSFYSTYRKTIRNRPNLIPGEAYLLEAEITSLDCNDTVNENNKDSQLFFIKEENRTPELKALLLNGNDCESIINNTKLSLVYESKDIKAKRYAIYILCILQTIVIIAMVVKK